MYIIFCSLVSLAVRQSILRPKMSISPRKYRETAEKFRHIASSQEKQVFHAFFAEYAIKTLNTLHRFEPLLNQLLRASDGGIFASKAHSHFIRDELDNACIALGQSPSGIPREKGRRQPYELSRLLKVRYEIVEPKIRIPTTFSKCSESNPGEHC